MFMPTWFIIARSNAPSSYGSTVAEPTSNVAWSVSPTRAVMDRATFTKSGLRSMPVTRQPRRGSGDACRAADAGTDVEQSSVGPHAEDVEQVLGGRDAAGVQLVQTGEVLDLQVVDVDARVAQRVEDACLQVVAAVVLTNGSFRIHEVSVASTRQPRQVARRSVELGEHLTDDLRRLVRLERIATLGVGGLLGEVLDRVDTSDEHVAQRFTRGLGIVERVDCGCHLVLR